jgi:hypothetical protein
MLYEFVRPFNLGQRTPDCRWGHPDDNGNCNQCGRRMVTVRERGTIGFADYVRGHYRHARLKRRSRLVLSAVNVPTEHDAESGPYNKHNGDFRKSGAGGRLSVPTPEELAAWQAARSKERFERQYEVDRLGHWIWKGYCDASGYGRFKSSGMGTDIAHRYAYMAYRGPIPKGTEIDHLCRIRDCVNPAHLEPVPHVVNIRRGDTGINNREKTHCPYGHEYDAENTRIAHRPEGPDGGTYRVCRACDRRRRGR